MKSRRVNSIYKGQPFVSGSQNVAPVELERGELFQMEYCKVVGFIIFHLIFHMQYRVFISHKDLFEQQMKQNTG